MLADETKQLYEQADKLSGDDLYSFLEQLHMDITTYMQHRREQETLRSMPANRRVRTKLLKGQNGLCGLCSVVITHGMRCCKDKTGKVVCGACNQYLTAWRHARAQGITEEQTVEFNE